VFFAQAAQVLALFSAVQPPVDEVWAGAGVRERLLDKDYALREAARQRRRLPELRGRDDKEIQHLGRPAQLHGALEGRDGLGDCAPAEVDEARGEEQEPVLAAQISLLDIKTHDAVCESESKAAAYLEAYTAA
jgi:hypothetical protein